MTTFATEFLGCKVSLADAQAVRERLIGDGHVEAESAAVRVVNTCCVTSEAVAKSRKAVRRAARSAERVYVTGCAANLEGAFDGLEPNVDRGGSPRGADAGHHRRGGGYTRLHRCRATFARTRAYVRVQDGCSFSCSYCVIPAVRGASRSRDSQGVLREVRRRAEQGHREIVLTGINLGCFRDRAAGMRLADLLVAVAEVDGIERVRLSSIEINHLTDGLLEALSHPGVAPHLHVPMQSGDDGVLRAMRRRYDRAGFLARMQRARAAVAGLNLTTDVIVGHPAEDEAAFSNTLTAVKLAGFSKVHVFRYSPRPDTVDAASDPVPPAVKADRSRRLRALSDRQGECHRRALHGTRQMVLVEENGARIHRRLHPGRGGRPRR